MKKAGIFALFLAMGLAGISLVAYGALERSLAGTPQFVAEFENELGKLEGLTPRAEKMLYELDRIIEATKLLARAGIGRGYESMERIVNDLPYCEETENIYEKAYAALGYLGRFDKRAPGLLLSEFNPQTDPIRAMNVLAGIKLTRNHQVLSGCVREIEPFMGEKQINARLQRH